MRLGNIARALMVLALIVFAGVWVASLILSPRAVLAQRVDPHSPDLAVVLGEAGTPVGSAQRLLIFDDRAFLDGTTPDGARLVSEKYLTENNVYPLQWKTIEFFRNAVAIGSSLTALLLGLAWRWFSNRSRLRLIKQPT